MNPSSLDTDILRVSIIDDHPMFRMGVVRGLEDEGGVHVVAEGSNADEALSIFQLHRPDVSILDLSMPGGGHAAIRAILQRDENALIVVLTASDQGADVYDAMKAGARGYVLKGVEVGDLVSVLRSVRAGETSVSPGMASRVLEDMRGDEASPEAPSPTHCADMPYLTPREEQILALVAQGCSNKEIGRMLTLQEKSIKHVMTRVLKKLQVRNRTEAAIQMREWQQRESSR
jgi:two-component system, NarL family, nitrate/nitrite response regulator NarL